MIDVTCPSCGKQYRLADDLSGKRVRCKECAETIAVPELATAGAAVSADDIAIAPAAAAAPVVAPALAPAPAPAKLAAPVFKSAPTPTPTAPRVKRLGFRLNHFTIALGIIGGFLLVTGLKEMRLASAASTTPQDISCMELAKNGPGKNAHVRLSDFLTTGGGVFQKEENADTWQMVWLPLMPIDGDFADRVRVIVKSSKVHTQADVDNFNDQHQTLTGMVINQVESMSAKEKRLLQQRYPDSDMDACWIIEEGREPASSAKYCGMMLGGAGLLLLGLWLTFKPR